MNPEQDSQNDTSEPNLSSSPPSGQLSPQPTPTTEQPKDQSGPAPATPAPNTFPPTDITQAPTPVLNQGAPAASLLTGSMLAKESSKRKGRSRLLLISLSLVILLGLGFATYYFVYNKSLIGTLSSESYGKLNFKRPANWEKTTVSSEEVRFHPKVSSGEKDGEKTYLISMAVVKSEKLLDGLKPQDMQPEQRSAFLSYTKTLMEKTPEVILPTPDEADCSTDAKLVGKMEDYPVPTTFFSIRYQFTCADKIDPKNEVVFTVVDLMQNDEDTGYSLRIRATDKNTHEKNKVKIEEIISSISL